MKKILCTLSVAVIFSGEAFAEKNALLVKK